MKKLLLLVPFLFPLISLQGMTKTLRSSAEECLRSSGGHERRLSDELRLMQLGEELKKMAVAALREDAGTPDLETAEAEFRKMVGMFEILKQTSEAQLEAITAEQQHRAKKARVNEAPASKDHLEAITAEQRERAEKAPVNEASASRLYLAWPGGAPVESHVDSSSSVGPDIPYWGHYPGGGCRR
jgi:hypothetical protein